MLVSGGDDWWWCFHCGGGSNVKPTKVKVEVVITDIPPADVFVVIPPSPK